MSLWGTFGIQTTITPNCSFYILCLDPGGLALTLSKSLCACIPQLQIGVSGWSQDVTQIYTCKGLRHLSPYGHQGDLSVTPIIPQVTKVI